MKQHPLIKEAISRGFVDGAVFTSATGVPGCVCSGKLIIKGSEYEREFRGDIVSSGSFGHGLIYDASTGAWGVPTMEQYVWSGTTRVNMRKVSIIDPEDNID